MEDKNQPLPNRAPARIDEERVRARVGGQAVLVTGAAGSIGSELCRRVACYGPRAVVGLDISENGLFELAQSAEFVPEIGDIRNARRVGEVLRKHRPSVVFHAAAHKHVPLMEDHIFEAVENNVLGTATLLDEAYASGVEDFVLISSDKAVNPASVMGATKRIAELMAQHLPAAPARTISVRFGNVLESNGSVVPIFRKQIARGGPVTVTHPDMQRYFVTAEDAVGLVLQACAMSAGRQIFGLEMGDPVRMVALAKSLIAASGREIRIEYTGIRPGEKLREELSSRDEQVLPTSHERIRLIAGGADELHDAACHLKKLRELCDSRNLSGLLAEIRQLVPDYNPAPSARR